MFRIFLKKSLKDMALSNSKIEKENIQDEIIDKEIHEKDKKEEKEEKVIEEKKVTETEAKNMANSLAKEYYNKGYNLGVKKIKEELEKGEKALAVNFKNLADNIFTITPDFAEKLNNQINLNLLKISKEMLGYEIDNKTNKFFEKISDLVNSFENSVKKVKIFLNKEDHDSISKYLIEKKIKIDQELAIDETLERGDLKIKSGSIEVSNILSNKTKFISSTNIEDDLKSLKEKIEKSDNEEMTKGNKPETKNNKTLSEQKN